MVISSSPSFKVDTTDVRVRRERGVFTTHLYNPIPPQVPPRWQTVKGQLLTHSGAVLATTLPFCSTKTTPHHLPISALEQAPLANFFLD